MILFALGLDHAITVLFLGTHEQLPRGSPIMECTHSNSLNFGVSMELEASELPKCLHIPGRKCANEDVRPLREVDCNIPHHLGVWIFTRLFGKSLALGSIGTSKLSEFRREQSNDG
ncbi:hypothetical protein DVH24_023288 [Malus domestica]|uniref:Uncharacterized protein n=1 Tax=Malus domestica TaxID=3750 RepID=A0A498KQF4_MALDO|nr:hypothetical protein DVH24_032819 [Malus domestica]RXI09847.1 hypothetical protein DVH24_023288 [Malus domestica]